MTGERKPTVASARVEPLVAEAGAARGAGAHASGLGVDPRGGIRIVLIASDTTRQQVGGDTVDPMLEVLRWRVAQLGVTEPTLRGSGAIAG